MQLIAMNRRAPEGYNTWILDWIPMSQLQTNEKKSQAEQRTRTIIPSETLNKDEKIAPRS